MRPFIKNFPNLFILGVNRLGKSILIALILFGIAAFEYSAVSAHDVYRELGQDIRGAGHIPECTDRRVLQQIKSKFAWADRKTWSKISHRPEKRAIEKFRDIRQRYQLEHTNSLIAHRHCNAKVDISNDHSHTIYYMIEEHMGFASISWRVNYCVLGDDRWHIYGANCKSLR